MNAQTTDTSAAARKLQRVTLKIDGLREDVPLLVLASETGMDTTQQRFEFGSARRVVFHLPEGQYILQVVAKDYRPGNAVLRVRAGHDNTLALTLRWAPMSHPTFAERLKAYGLSPDKAIKLELKPREHHVVPSHPGPGVVATVAHSLAELRGFIGAPTGLFDHDEPRFGPVEVGADTLERLRAGKPTAADRNVAKHAAREALFGNEKAVGGLCATLDPVLKRFMGAAILLHVHTVLEIPAGATYQFGPGTLIVDELRIHKTGRLVPVGQCKIDVGSWIEFE